MTTKIEVKGLQELQGSLRRVKGDLPKIMELFLGKAAEMTKDDAASLVPRGPSGAARASLRVERSRSTATVSGGGRRAPYYGWLEHGGKVGIKESVDRRYVRAGRYVWPAFDKNRRRLLELLEDDVLDLIRATGLEVT